VSGCIQSCGEKTNKQAKKHPATQHTKAIQLFLLAVVCVVHKGDLTCFTIARTITPAACHWHCKKKKKKKKKKNRQGRWRENVWVSVGRPAGSVSIVEDSIHL